MNTKTLFVRISDEAHQLLQQLAALDAFQNGNKQNLKRTIERLILEEASRRGPFPRPPE